MIYHLLVFAIAFCLLGFYDFIWLGFIAKSFYKRNFASLSCATLTGIHGKWWAALTVYSLMALGFVVFIFPLLTAEPSFGNPVHGALFGLIVFGSYQCTNYIVFRDWPLMLALVDTAWGMFTYALTSCITMGILRALTAYGLV